jgi:hypothetical protein
MRKTRKIEIYRKTNYRSIERKKKKPRKVVKMKEFSRSFENEYVREYICSVHNGIVWIRLHRVRNFDWNRLPSGENNTSTNFFNYTLCRIIG